MMVAVGFSPRLAIQKGGRRGATLERALIPFHSTVATRRHILSVLLPWVETHGYHRDFATREGSCPFLHFPVTACVLALGCPQSSVGRQMTDPENFEVFVRNYQDMVFSTALRLLGNPADAEDIAQTVFLKAYERFAELSHSPTLGGWLKAVATNLSLNHLSRYRARWRFFSELRTDDSEFVDDQPAPEAPEQSLAEADDRRWLKRDPPTPRRPTRAPSALSFSGSQLRGDRRDAGHFSGQGQDRHSSRAPSLAQDCPARGLSELGANRGAPVSRRATRRRENPLAAFPCGPPCNDSRVVCRPVSHLIPHALVPMEPDPRLEHFIDEQLRRLPPLTAPLTLLTRVMTAIATRAGLPWWSRRGGTGRARCKRRCWSWPWRRPPWPSAAIWFWARDSARIRN